MITLLSSIVTFNLLAYIGPGGGIALLGPLLGLIAAVIGALAMVALWPIRYLLKKSRTGNAQTAPVGDRQE